MLEKWIDARAVQRAVLVLLPVGALAFATDNPLWLRAALVTISCFIAAERTNLAPLGVTLQGIAVAVGFLALFFALLIPPLFVVGCALMAAAVIRLSGRGRKLRSLGSFTFIPALYVACETAENSPRDLFPARAIEVLPYLLAAVLPVLALSTVDTLRTVRARGINATHGLGRLRRDGDLGDRSPYGEALIAVFLAVAAAAAIVEWQHLAHGQWAIWSAVSVVTGDVATVQRKLRDRAAGALIGVPPGIALGVVLPHDKIVFGLVLIAAVLTLVAFRVYVMGFGARCACVASGLVTANEPTVAASERVLNVIWVV